MRGGAHPCWTWCLLRRAECRGWGSRHQGTEVGEEWGTRQRQGPRGPCSPRGVSVFYSEGDGCHWGFEESQQLLKRITLAVVWRRNSRGESKGSKQTNSSLASRTQGSADGRGGGGGQGVEEVKRGHHRLGVRTALLPGRAAMLLLKGAHFT